MTDLPEIADPLLWSDWIIESAFDICSEVLRVSQRRFGVPILFGLSEDGTHHANALMFWSNDNKDKSMELVRNIISSQKHVAVALMALTVINDANGTRQAISLVVKCKYKSARLIVRPIDNDGSLGEPVEYKGVEGKLTRFWNDESVSQSLNTNA